MYNLDLFHVFNELQIIINNCDKYPFEIVLNAIACINNINIGNNSHVVNNKLIENLTLLQKSLECHIDFDLLNYLHLNNIRVKINVTKNITANEWNTNCIKLQKEINEMRVKDNILLNKIMSNTTIDKYEHYEYCDREIMQSIKKVVQFDRRR